nr:ABC transporter permease [Candidatus Pantoea persica]
MSRAMIHTLWMLAALLDGLLTAGVVWLFAWRNGVETFRLIIIGISVRALMRALSWLTSPLQGQVLLDSEAISCLSTKEVARRLGLLPQSSQTPTGKRAGSARPLSASVAIWPLARRRRSRGAAGDAGNRRRRYRRTAGGSALWRPAPARLDRHGASAADAAAARS